MAERVVDRVAELERCSPNSQGCLAEVVVVKRRVVVVAVDQEEEQTHSWRVLEELLLLSWLANF